MNLTALMCLYVKSYYGDYFNDEISKKLLTKEESDLISKSLSDGISFFDSKYEGSEEGRVEYILNNYIGPTILRRSIFNESSLKNDIRLGCKQYLVLACGYDVSGYNDEFKNLKVFEIDKEDMIDDKIKRLDNNCIDYSNVKLIKGDLSKNLWINDLVDNSYKTEEKTFCSMLGLSNYLTKNEFENIICNISKILSKGSTLVFDYPTGYSEKSGIISSLAEASGNDMKTTYSYEYFESMLEKNDMLIYECTDGSDINIGEVSPVDGVKFILAVKQ